MIDQEIVFSQNDKKDFRQFTHKDSEPESSGGRQSRVLPEPLLQIEKLTRQGEDIPYKRDAQVIIAEYKLHPYESLELDITYNGSIDENICYLDITDEEYYDTQTGSSILRFGKKIRFRAGQIYPADPGMPVVPLYFSTGKPGGSLQYRKKLLKLHAKK